jgi:hypothetical protein
VQCVDDDFEGLMDRLTNHLIEHGRAKRWRQMLKNFLYGSIVVLAAGVVVLVAWFCGWVPR